METFFIAIFALVIGLALLFAGYRLFLVMLPIWGFFGGFWFGAEAINLLVGDGFLATTTGWIVGFFAGLLFAVLSYLFYAIGIALVSGTIGAAIVGGVLGWIGIDSGILHFIFIAVGAIVAAGLTLLTNLQKYVIIILTALGGANAILLSALLLFDRVQLGELESAGSAIRPVLDDSWFWSILWLVLAGLGLIAQLRTNRSYEFQKEYYMEGWG